jgi:hypothetical protein
MKEYARQRGLHRLLIRVPVLTPRLSSLWLGLVTPVYARVGRKLINSIRHPTVVTNDAARKRFPDIRPLAVREAIALAVRNAPRLTDARSVRVDAPPAAAFRPVRRIGGARGWYYGNWLWRVRGLLDLLVGGVGMHRGRRDPEQLGVGDTLDCWRVEAYEPDRRLLLRAEMRLPGRAWLEFRVDPDPDGGTVLHQTASFDPRGVLGRLYWWISWPIHQVHFAGMLREVARRALHPCPTPAPVADSRTHGRARNAPGKE